MTGERGICCWQRWISTITPAITCEGAEKWNYTPLTALSSFMQRSFLSVSDVMAAPMATINNLPNEVLVHIFSYVPVQDLALNVQSVCVRWSELCMTNTVWKHSSFVTKEYMSDDYIISVLQRMPMLQCFHTDKNSAAIICALSQHCKNLRKLMARNTYEVEEIKETLQNCKKLEELTISDVVLLNEELEELVGQCKNLSSLSVIFPVDVRVKMKYIAEGCPALKHLDMCGSWNSCDLKYFLEQKNELLSLRINHATEDDLCVIPLIARCATLQKLQLEGQCYDCSLTTMSTKTLSRLTSLSIVIPYIMGDDMEKVFKERALSQLLELELQEGAPIQATLIHAISHNCPNLLRLRLKRAFKLSDDALRDLYMCTKLEELELNNCIFLTDTAMEYISKCARLKHLNLCLTRIKSWNHLLDLSELKYLSIIGCDMSGLPLKHFPLNLKNLKQLTLLPYGSINMGALDILHTKMPNLKVDFSTCHHLSNED